MVAEAGRSSAERQVGVRAPPHDAARRQVEAGHGSVWGVRDATSLRPDAACRSLLPPTLPPTFQTYVAVMELIKVSSD